MNVNRSDWFEISSQIRPFYWHHQFETVYFVIIYGHKNIYLSVEQIAWPPPHLHGNQISTYWFYWSPSVRCLMYDNHEIQISVSSKLVFFCGSVVFVVHLDSFLCGTGIKEKSSILCVFEPRNHKLDLDRFECVKILFIQTRMSDTVLQTKFIK